MSNGQCWWRLTA